LQALWIEPPTQPKLAVNALEKGIRDAYEDRAHLVILPMKRDASVTIKEASYEGRIVLGV
jgi:hypothetical protein